MYKYYEIIGGNKLSGEIRINGAKNSSLPILIATTLINDEIILEDIPKIEDINIIKSILERMGSKIKFIFEEDESFTLIVNNKEFEYKELVYEDVSKLRASYYFIGALVGRYNKVKILLPGGCFLGERPIDLHIKGLETLGCKIKWGKSGNYDLLEVTSVNGLKGEKIFLDFPSVGATINLILAAVNAEGETIIENAAKEPEIVDVTTFLRSMGANIKGAGTDVIKIIGKNKFKKCKHQIIPDRIEAGTYLMIASLLAENLTISNIIPEHLEALLAKLKEIGLNIEVLDDSILVKKVDEDNLNPIALKTGVYPSFPTDLQQIMTTLLTQIEGESIIEDNIYVDRFRNCQYLNEMGANIEVSKSKSAGRAIINGKTKLCGEEVIATDLRAGASLIFAALLSEGNSKIFDISHILRGYYEIDKKLKNVGADIKLIKKEDNEL